MEGGRVEGRACERERPVGGTKADIVDGGGRVVELSSEEGGAEERRSGLGVGAGGD